MSRDPHIRSGALVIKGTRFPTSRLLAELAEGVSLQEICKDYDLIEKDARAALREAARLLDPSQ